MACHTSPRVVIATATDAESPCSHVVTMLANAGADVSFRSYRG